MASVGMVDTRIATISAQCAESNFLPLTTQSWWGKSIELSGVVATLPADRLQESIRTLNDDQLRNVILCEAYTLAYTSKYPDLMTRPALDAGTYRDVFTEFASSGAETSSVPRVDGTFQILGQSLDSKQLLRLRSLMIEARGESNEFLHDALSRMLRLMTESARQTSSPDTLVFLDVVWLFDGEQRTSTEIRQHFDMGSPDETHRRFESACEAAVTSGSQAQFIDLLADLVLSGGTASELPPHMPAVASDGRASNDNNSHRADAGATLKQ